MTRFLHTIKQEAFFISSVNIKCNLKMNLKLKNLKFVHPFKVPTNLNNSYSKESL